MYTYIEQLGARRVEGDVQDLLKKEKKRKGSSL